jgi:hypothetical protein
MKTWGTIFISLFCNGLIFSQQTFFGTSNYIEYQAGTLPIILSVPHGGALTPASIPDRTCNNPTTVTDSWTIETALEIKKSLYELTGCYPHIIICHLRRRKIDCNRNLQNGACSNSEAEIAWNEYHIFVKQAREKATLQHGLKNFYIDLHGHGNPIQRIELGYLLDESTLALSDSILNLPSNVNASSIKKLSILNFLKFTHAQLLRGKKSFGTLLDDEGYPAVPSQNIPSPGIGSNYFNGGYSTQIHTCFNPALDINGLQMELNFNGVRDSPANRTKFGQGFAKSIKDYMATHFNYNFTNCSSPTSTLKLSEEKIYVFPNPVKIGQQLQLKMEIDANLHFSITNQIGQNVGSGLLIAGQKTIDLPPLNAGVYIIGFILGESKQYIKILIQE